MVKRLFATAVLLCALPVWLLAQQAKPAPAPTPEQPSTSPTIIHIPVNLVNVPLTVTDKKNRLVIMLTKDDFNAFEDGQPQAIKYFSRETDLALRIGILIDTSNSIRDRFRFEQQAAIDFLVDTIRPGKDLAFVLGFDVEPQLVQDYTDNLEKLSAAIRSLQPGGVTTMEET